MRNPVHTADSTTLKVQGTIGGFWSGNTLDHLQAALKGMQPTAKKVVLHIHSGGGSVTEGVAIINELQALRAHDIRIVARIQGFAGSMASVLAAAADHTEMCSNAMWMMHKAWTIALGNSDEMGSVKEMLDAADASIIDTYEKKTGKSFAELKALIQHDKWLTPTQAKELGFVDAIVSPDMEVDADAIKQAEEIEDSDLMVAAFHPIPTSDPRKRVIEASAGAEQSTPEASAPATQPDHDPSDNPSTVMNKALFALQGMLGITAADPTFDDYQAAIDSRIEAATEAAIAKAEAACAAQYGQVLADALVKAGLVEPENSAHVARSVVANAKGEDAATAVATELSGLLKKPTATATLGGGLASLLGPEANEDAKADPGKEFERMAYEDPAALRKLEQDEPQKYQVLEAAFLARIGASVGGPLTLSNMDTDKAMSASA